MQAKNNVIVLNENEDVNKLDDLMDSSLKELLQYQEDSSAFDSDDQKAVLKNLPPDLSVKQIKLVEGFFPIHYKKSNLNNLQVSIQEGFIKTASSGQIERRKTIKPNCKNQIIPCENSVGQTNSEMDIGSTIWK